MRINHICPEKVVSKARDYLESFTKRKLITLPMADNLLKVMDVRQASQKASSLQLLLPRQVVSINKWLFSIKQKRLIPVALIHPFWDGFMDELKRIQDNAFGIKLQPEFQNLRSQFYIRLIKKMKITQQTQHFKSFVTLFPILSYKPFVMCFK
ncbi:MAG: hypothetical protein LBQ04_03270 [Endomicrobium sp.]|jgi:hypothetical protein|nr:hypothetical protein [Endomicrobium sp.]